MWIKKHTSLKKVYYGSFLILIVVPILLIFGIALGVIHAMLRNAAISNINSAQESIMEMLKTDIKDASLQLSHFVHVNSGEFMMLAAETDTDLVSKRYENTELLEEAFQVALTPKQDIVSMQFFMKDGKSTYLKDELAMTMQEVKKSKWYQSAKENETMVCVDAYDTSDQPLTYSKLSRGKLVLAAALAPNIALDRSGLIDVVSLFYQSDVGGLIQDYEKRALVGTTVLLNEKNDIIYQRGDGERGTWYLEQLSSFEPGVYNLKVNSFEQDGRGRSGYTYVVSKTAQNGWKVVNFLPSKSLTLRFNQFVAVLLAVILILFLLFYLFSRYFLRNILTPVHNVVEGMTMVQAGNLETHLEPEGQHEIRQMIHSFNRMVRRLKTLIEENEQAMEKRHEAEIKALQSQINPHFLVNTLNSIRFMAQVSKFEGIRKMAESLIRIVACSFRSNISFYTLKEEMEVLDSYIYLMKIRYSEGFDVTYRIEEDCLGFMVPRLILQPLAENSIVHGFTGEDIGHLVISAKKEETMLVITVWDDGKGMDQEQIRQLLSGKEMRRNDNTSIGFENVITRLKLNFGEKCRVEVRSEPGTYTEIVLYLPIIEDENDEKGTYC